jgi:hypothetical protein
MGKIKVKDFTLNKFGKSFLEIKYNKMKKRCGKKLNIIILQANTELSFSDHRKFNFKMPEIDFFMCRPLNNMLAQKMLIYSVQPNFDLSLNESGAPRKCIL